MTAQVKIICVDDERLVLELAVSLCRELPQRPEVEGFTRSTEALSWFRGHTADIALLDINMPDMDGLALAARIKELSPDTAVIFLTGHARYAVDAFAMHASGYLLKPVSPERLAAEIEYAMKYRKDQSPPPAAHILARTFGEFDLYVDGEVVSFPRAKAKELLAYLVDRQGGSVTRATVFAALWGDAAYDRSMQKQLDVVIRSLRSALEEHGAAQILEMKQGSMRVVPERFTCDMYRFFAGDADAVNAYRGEYMSSYSWASLTEAYLDRINKRL